MNKSWLGLVFILSFILLALLKGQEVRSLARYFKADRIIKVERFRDVKAGLSTKDQELFELWESILIGRTAPLSQWIKDRYKLLALNHLFTPSGFHLSALLLPFMKFIKTPTNQIILLSVLGFCFFWLPGFGALKRMLVIKGHQQFLGMKAGFVVAMLMDILFGTFQDATLSFTYSFLFLGIIYSGKKNLHLLILFFAAQMLIAYFQGMHVSPLLIFLSPVLNFSFGIAMPFLFLLALPMWSWQVTLALSILKILQALVDLSAQLVSYFPAWEITIMTLILFILIYTHQRKYFYIGLILLSGSLNINQLKNSGSGTYDFRPRGVILKIFNRAEDDIIYFTDGKCKRRLVNGYWEEKCSPVRRSTSRNKIKKPLRLS